MARAGRLWTSTYSPDVIVCPTERISGWLNKARKNSVLGKRWRLPLGTHGTLIFPKKNQELVWGKHSGILKYCSDNATTQAFATDILSFGFERTQDARQ